jgi:hypothetical protein
MSNRDREREEEERRLIWRTPEEENIPDNYFVLHLEKDPYHYGRSSKWRTVEQYRQEGIVVGYSGSDWIIKEGEKVLRTSGTISVTLDELESMPSGSCKIHNNEINQSERYAICKEDNKIKIFEVERSEN